MARPESIVITGGASGIGLAITNHFASTASENRHITFLDINPAAGAQTLATLRSQHPSASLSFEPCDTSSWESQATVFDKVYKERGGVDVVFANAGITGSGGFIQSALASGEKEGKGGPIKPDTRTVNVNFLGVVYSVHLAIHYISKNIPSTTNTGDTSIKGSIVCTASNAGLYAFPIAPIYSATKHAVVGLVRSLARGLEKEQIRINALAPAVIETNIAPSSELFKSMILTPMESAIKAVDKLVGDASLTGKVAELHGEHVTFAEAPAHVDEDTKTNIEMFWNLGYA